MEFILLFLGYFLKMCCQQNIKSKQQVFAESLPSYHYLCLG